MKSRTLKQDFERRKKWINHRSSTIYPINIKNNSDFLLLFLNYWKLKNKINKLRCNLKFFNEEGNIIKFYKYKIKTHNEIYISKILPENYFSGMLEVEFISPENLGYPFPGISGFYVSPQKLISGVHAAGRILNSNEKKNNKIHSLESNFSLKYVKNKTVPFVSLFNSKKRKRSNPIILELKNSVNKTIKKKLILNELKKPFSNKIFYLDDYFKNLDLLKSNYCVVKTNNVDVIPRMICGNYHKDYHHYEVTHSYPVQENKKDIIDNKHLNKNNVEHMSFLPFLKSKNTNLKLRIFPTNLNAVLRAKLFVFDKKNKKLKRKKNIFLYPGKKMFELNLKNKNDEFGCISLKQKNVPSRINTSYIYYNNNKFGTSTDTALGFKSIDYPLKKTHWGSFIASSQIKSEILIRRINHLKTLKKAKGTIIFYGKNFKKEIKMTLLPTDFKIIFPNKIIKKLSKKINTYSWIAKFENGSGIEIFWNSYSNNFITGDHSF